jgi:hypothetical protein
MGLPGDAATTAFAVVNGCITIWALTIVSKQAGAWDASIPDVDVYTISHEAFWGPVHMLVPRDCSDMERMIGGGEANEGDTSSSGGESDGANDTNASNASSPGEKEDEANETNASTPEEKADVEVNVSRLLSGVVPAASAIETDSPPQPPRSEFLSEGQHLPERDVFGFPRVPSGVAIHELVNLIQLNRCGVAIEESDPTGSQKYFAMVFLAGNNDDIEELRRSRHYMFVWLAINIYLTLFLALCQPVFKLLVLHRGLCDNTPVYEVLKDSENKEKADGITMTFVKQLPRKTYVVFTTMVQQAMICSLFLTYWDTNHYVMSYIPGTGYILLMVTTFLTYGFLLAMLACGEAAAPCAVLLACWNCFAFPCVTVPFCGYSFYLYQFLWQTNFGQVFDTEAFSVEYPVTVEAVGGASHVMVGFNVVDMFLGTFLQAFCSQF